LGGREVNGNFEQKPQPQRRGFFIGFLHFSGEPGAKFAD
jgi:hypothetical protein